MKKPLDKECLVEFLNLPPREQLLFILDRKLDVYLEDKYNSSLKNKE